MMLICSFISTTTPHSIAYMVRVERLGIDDVQLLVSGAKCEVGIPHCGRMSIDFIPNDGPGSMVKNLVRCVNSLFIEQQRTVLGLVE